MIGQTISHYKILDKIGEGGMGIVYRAHDTKLDRTVALKFLPGHVGGDENEKKRFINEAKAASALDHNNICSIYSIEETDEGTVFIVMAYYEGMPLRQKIEQGPLPLKDVVNYTIQIASGLQKAHEKGIVHRDLKPANIFITNDDQVKIIDFGLARVAERTLLTKSGTTLGTVPYMSPEQAQGTKVDHRTDIWSLGVIIYEMITGQRPFRSEYETALVYLIINDNPEPLQRVISDISSDLVHIVNRALAKDPESRYASAAEMVNDLKKYRNELQAKNVSPLKMGINLRSLSKPRIAIPSVILLFGLILIAMWFFNRQAAIRWAQLEAPLEVERLLSELRFFDAFAVTQNALDRIPGDPRLQNLLESTAIPVTIQSEPEGARFFYKPYLDPEKPWNELGTTPFEGVLLPKQHLRWRMEMEGYEAAAGSFPTLWLNLNVTLLPEERARPGMVWIQPGAVEIAGDMVELDDFWIDRYEVTNQEFSHFVAAGGYDDEELWGPILNDGEMTWEETRREFRDRTGRQGPANWELGRPPEGTGNLPVSDISWYEAAAYCRFLGKDLPTVYHWRRAAGNELYMDIQTMSNFSGRGPAPVGQYHGISRNGVYDMAGNVKEWCWNATGDNRYILGGAWNEPEYQYHNDYARPPAERGETFGFRCVLYDQPPDTSLFEPIDRIYYDFSGYKPVDDDVFAILRRFYEYSPGPLDVRVERVEETDLWRHETVSFTAAYGRERVIAHLFIPYDVSPPYQSVIYFPGSNALLPGSSYNPNDLAFMDFLIRDGRVLVYPVYQNMYERAEPAETMTMERRRQRIIHWSQDVGRTIDYLETRPEIDHETIGFFGLSLGAVYGPVFGAVEERLGPQIYMGGGLMPVQRHWPPEMFPLNFAPRVRAPVLKVGGESDFHFGPPEVTRRPVFDLLGTPDEHKRFAMLEGAHIPDWTQVIRETLDWLDRYQGPVIRGRVE
jgi:eukaryotic-like serine/threonine-protein kinase